MNTKQFLFGSMPESTSPAGTFNNVDFMKWLRHLAVGAIALLVSFLFDSIGQYLTNTNFGQWQILVTFFLTSGGVEFIRRYVANHIPLE